MNSNDYFKDTDEPSYIIENYDKLNKEAIEVLKANYKDYTKILDLYKEVKANIILKQLATIKRVLIILYNSKEDYNGSFDFEVIKHIILQLNAKEVKITKKRKIPSQDVKKIQADRIKSFLKEKISDEKLIDKYIEEIFSCSKPKDFERITEKEILAHFDVWKEY